MTILTHALVLTAGLGTRLQPLTFVRAKPAMPVGGEPLVRRIIVGLARAGVTDVIMNLHHLPQTLTAVVGDGADLAVRVRYSWEHPRILGSAGGIRQALDIVGADTFLVVNGDTLSDLDVRGVVETHVESGALVTLALVPNVEHMRYGGVRLDADGRVTGFVPRGTGAADSFHFFGVQVVSGSVFADLPRGECAQSVGGLYDRLIAERPGSVRGFVTDARSWDIGTVADYWKTARALTDGDVDHFTHVVSSATVTRSIVWDDVEIGNRAIVDECILTDGVRVAADATFRRSILARGADGQLVVTPLDIP